MTILSKGAMYEIIQLDQFGRCRLYCENISQARETDILTNLGVEYICQSKCNEQFDGALILDFNSDDLVLVQSYFGD